MEDFFTLKILPSYIDGAKDKDKECAINLLKYGIEYLEKKEPLPKALAEYFIECFENILKQEDSKPDRANASRALNLIGIKKNQHFQRNVTIAIDFINEQQRLFRRNGFNPFNQNQKDFNEQVAQNLIHRYGQELKLKPKIDKFYQEWCEPYDENDPEDPRNSPNFIPYPRTTSLIISIFEEYESHAEDKLESLAHDLADASSQLYE